MSLAYGSAAGQLLHQCYPVILLEFLAVILGCGEPRRHRADRVGIPFAHRAFGADALSLSAVVGVGIVIIGL